MAAGPTNLGPLPAGDRNDDLQQLSIAALCKSLPVERFQYRDERENDKGIDGSLELKIDGRFTDFRAVVQVKGTDDATVNTDESVSLRVNASNLNYLLNGPCPFYVLWIAPRDELRYTWARDEARRLQQENPEWMQQQTVTLRFTRVIAPPEWDAIFDRILGEGRLHRQTHDILARAAVAEPVVVGIDSASLAVTDPDEVYKTLRTSGMAIVAAGYASYALDQSRLLSPARAEEARLQLVFGYARYLLGEYFTARGHVARTQLGEGNLSPLDQYFRQALQLACDYQLGRIDAAAFRQAQERLESVAPPALASQLRLDRLRLEHLRGRGDTRRGSLIRELQEVSGQIESDADTAASTKLQARLVRLYAQAMETGFGYLHEITRLRMRQDMGLSTRPWLSSAFLLSAEPRTQR
jgi:hypothetical protein